MNVEVHFSVMGFSNCFLVAAESPQRGKATESEKRDTKEALLIDPGIFDESLLMLIEGNHYEIKHVLLTHNHQSHVHGLKTLKKIYAASIYARSPVAEGFRTNVLKDGDTITLSNVGITVIEVPGHSEDSLVFKVENILFTGDAIGAGRIGNTHDSTMRSLLIDTLEEKILSIPGNLFIFPGHGPLSTLDAERNFNADLL